MSDIYETHEDAKEASCIGPRHTWEVLCDYADDEEQFEYYGTQGEVIKYMETLYDDLFDGYEEPEILAQCDSHNITLHLVRNKY
jgi:hypothetical protein